MHTCLELADYRRQTRRVPGIRRRQEPFQLDSLFTMNILKVFFVLTLGLVSSCAVTEFDLDREVYERQIKQVRLGMSFDEFQNLFPQRISRGAIKSDVGTIAAYEVAYAYYSFAATGVERRLPKSSIPKGS